MSKIALNMIVKGDEPRKAVSNCLSSVMPYVDGAFIVITTPDENGLADMLRSDFDAVVEVKPYAFHRKVQKKEIEWVEEFIGRKSFNKVGKKLFQFDDARNYALDMIPDEYDWFIWLDADDVLSNGKYLRKLIDRADTMKPQADSIFLNYLYDVELDETGKVKNIIIEHLRERLLRNNSAYKWIGSIHETLIEQRPTVKIENREVQVVHLSNNDRKQQAIQRNINNLELEIYDSKGKDPRPVYYLGKAYFDLHDPEEYGELCVKLFTAYINTSGWTEERAQAWEYLAEVYRLLGQHNNSIKSCLNALQESPVFPSIYLNLALSYLCKEDWDKALHWVKMSTKVPMPQTTLIKNPRDLAARALEVVYLASLKKNLLDEAWAAATKLQEIFPNDKIMQERVEFTQGLRTQRGLSQKVLGIAQFLAKAGESEKLKTLVASIPAFIVDNPFMADLAKKVIPPRVWDEDEIAIFCGPGFTNWSPKSVDEPKGSFIGGSEEAVIYNSRELVKQGWKVTVYADPGEDAGEYDGVNYLPYYKFNRNDSFNILIGWRNIRFVDGNYDAKKIYIWCHDVLNPLEHTPERLSKIEKLIVLSPAHRDTVPEVPDEKIFISTNGYYEHLPKDSPDNDPKKVIWTSSYDRGLDHLLDIWEDVKDAVPEAELHVFYGWQLFKRFYKDNPERMAWMGKINRQLEHDGVVHHGRVSQVEVEKWHKRCGIWAYPTHFYEINCITAIKSQLWGCVPVVIDYAALNTTVQYGRKIKGDIYEKETEDAYKEALIAALKDEKWQDKERKKMMSWARDKFSWESVAAEWTREFKSAPLREAKSEDGLHHDKSRKEGVSK